MTTLSHHRTEMRDRKWSPTEREVCGFLSKLDLKSASVQQPLFMQPLPFPLSSRAKPRDLQFRGPLLETRNTILKQNCHLDRSVA
jgi:hypothetical protein